MLCYLFLTNNSAYQVLGFSNISYDIETTVTSPNQYKLSGENQCILFITAQDENIISMQQEGSYNIDGDMQYFANIPLTSSPGSYTFYNPSSDYPLLYKYKRGPLRVLDKLYFSFFKIRRGITGKSELLPFGF